MRVVIDKAHAALGELCKLIPLENNEAAIGHVMELQRAIYLLGQADDYLRQVANKVYHWDKEVERAQA